MREELAIEHGVKLDHPREAYDTDWTIVSDSEAYAELLDDIVEGVTHTVVDGKVDIEALKELLDEDIALAAPVYITYAKPGDYIVSQTPPNPSCPPSGVAYMTREQRKTHAGFFDETLYEWLADELEAVQSYINRTAWKWAVYSDDDELLDFGYAFTKRQAKWDIQQTIEQYEER